MAEHGALYAALIKGDASAAVAAARETLDGGADPLALVSGEVTPAMNEVGRRFECSEYFIPELLLAARATKKVFELIRPRLGANGAAASAGDKVVILGTVQGDLHDIGKNLVASMLEGGGFQVVDLGVNVPVAKFIEAVKQRDAAILGLSALLTTTLPAMKTVLQALTAAGLRDRVKVMVGGAPVSRKYAEEIGADGYADNAGEAPRLARRLLGVASA